MRNGSLLSLFQFHKGTIRTKAHAIILRVASDFNSIKVQLERVDFLDAFLVLLHFNSIKVQLERDPYIIR